MNLDIAVADSCIEYINDFIIALGRTQDVCS